MGASIAGVGPLDVAVGVIAHHLTGVLLGLLLGFLVAYLGPNAVPERDPVASVVTGVVYGLVVYSVVFVPALVFLFAPTMAGLMGEEAASSMMPVVLAFGFQEHVLYGAITALAISYLGYSRLG
jgi:hypothetical protein